MFIDIQMNRFKPVSYGLINILAIIVTNKSPFWALKGTIRPLRVFLE